jgi:hypothetical protein
VSRSSAVHVLLLMAWTTVWIPTNKGGFREYVSPL